MRVHCSPVAALVLAASSCREITGDEFVQGQQLLRSQLWRPSLGNAAQELQQPGLVPARRLESRQIQAVSIVNSRSHAGGLSTLTGRPAISASRSSALSMANSISPLATRRIVGQCSSTRESVSSHHCLARRSISARCGALQVVLSLELDSIAELHKFPRGNSCLSNILCPVAGPIPHEVPLALSAGTCTEPVARQKLSSPDPREERGACPEFRLP